VIEDHLERMRSMVAQAVAEASRLSPNGRLAAVHLIVYGGFDAAHWMCMSRTIISS
jgi:hypothetical protein